MSTFEELAYTPMKKWEAKKYLGIEKAQSVL